MSAPKREQRNNKEHNAKHVLVGRYTRIHHCAIGRVLASEVTEVLDDEN